MAFRFFRRFTLDKGIQLNLSRSGPSISLGPPGAKFTVGLKGTRGTLGIPGTGLFYTKQNRFEGLSGKSDGIGRSLIKLGVALGVVSVLLDKLKKR